MIGRAHPEMVAMRFVPPNSTGAASTTSTSATSQVLTPWVVEKASPMALACTMLNAKPNANSSRTANTTPQRREPSPRWM